MRICADASRVMFMDGLRFIQNAKTGYWLHRNTGTRLHRYIWIKNKGKIPIGFDVHHKDFDKQNNVIENLQLLSRSEHIKIHNNNLSIEQRDKLRIHAAKIRVMTKKWHASKDGHEWHVKHGKIVWDNMPSVKKVCLICGVLYSVKKSRELKSKYCSGNCKARALRARRNNESEESMRRWKV